MLNVKEIDENIATAFFLEDPALCYIALPDHDLVSLYQEKKWYKTNGSYLIGIYVEEELIFIMKYEFFTPIAVNVHFYLKSTLRNKGIFKDIQKLLKKWITNNTNIRKILAMSPKSCEMIAHVCEKFGFVKEGHLKNSIIWRNKIDDLLIYGLNLENN